MDNWEKFFIWFIILLSIHNFILAWITRPEPIVEYETVYYYVPLYSENNVEWLKLPVGEIIKERQEDD
jgi:hypothetical protein